MHRGYRSDIPGICQALPPPYPCRAGTRERKYQILIFMYVVDPTSEYSMVNTLMTSSIPHLRGQFADRGEALASISAIRDGDSAENGPDCFNDKRGEGFSSLQAF